MSSNLITPPDSMAVSGTRYLDGFRGRILKAMAIAFDGNPKISCSLTYPGTQG